MKRRLAILIAGMLLPVLAAADAQSAAGLWGKQGARQNDVLAVDSAFRLIAARRSGDTVVVSWAIAPGYYLYRQRLHFQATQPDGVHLLPPALPPAERLDEADAEHAQIYRTSLHASLGWDPAAAAPRQLSVSYQGCAAAGFCYPPQIRLVDVVPAATP